MPASGPLPRTASWSYVRLHYGHRGRRGNYSPKELDAWAERIRALEGDVLVYFNNDSDGVVVDMLVVIEDFAGLSIDDFDFK